MNKRQPGLAVAAILLVAALFLSSCKQSVSEQPLATPTLITPTGLFVTPLSADNPMQMIEQFAQGTAAAQTAAARGGTPTTPQAVATQGTGLAITPLSGTTQTPATPTNNVVIATTSVAGTTQIVGITPVVGTTAITTVATTPVVVGTLPTSGPKPSTYTLQKGEWPYCIARRFNVNPDELLTLSGLSVAQSDALMPGQILKIPQTNNPFPGDRALHKHPTTYSVPSADTTMYGVACYFGDVDPAALAAANGLSVSSTLTSGQQLTIP